MNLLPLPALALFLTVALSLLPAPLSAQLPGGYSTISKTDRRAVAAAEAALASRGGTLRLLSIESAAQQIVAGTNFHLILRLDDGGRTRRAEAVIWEKLGGGFQTTTWKWLDEAPAQPGLLKSEFIYDTGPYPSVHATTIVETPTGLVSAWFGGTAEKNPDVCIWVSRFVDGKWTESVETANGLQPDGTRHPTWNPVLFQPKTGPLLLFYKVGPSPSTWWGELKTSTDGGKTWSAAQRLPQGIYGPIKNKPVQLTNGDLLCPTSNETDTKPSAWAIYFERTSDLGKTWTRTELLHDGLKIGAIQPSVLFLGGDKLLAIGRSKNSKLFQIASDDAGKTWGAISLTTLPNPNSGTDAVTLTDGRHLLVYNHTAKGRSPLNLAVSKDGQAWEAALVLENEPAREFSYPAIIQTRDGLVHITYTWKRAKAKHVVVDPARLVTRPIVDGQWPN